MQSLQGNGKGKHSLDADTNLQASTILGIIIASEHLTSNVYTIHYVLKNENAYQNMHVGISTRIRLVVTKTEQSKAG
jgi:hypothetical protein